MYYENKIQKIIAITSFISIIIGNLFAYYHPARGYELSMYDSTPFLVWLFFFISILGGIIVLVSQVKFHLYNKSNFWLIGLLILLICRFSILYIPYTRGYYTFYYDQVGHIGMIKDILSNGNISIFDYYPISHILLVEVCLISRLPILLVSNHSTAMFSLLFVISIYLLSHYSMGKDIAILSVASIGGVIFGGYDFFLMPNGWSMLFMPLAVYVYFKSDISFEYKILLVLILIIYPLFHSFSTFVLIFYLFVIWFTKFAIVIWNKKEKDIDKNESYTNILSDFPKNSILILVVISLLWILNFKAFWPIIRHLYYAIFTGKSSNIIGGMTDTLQKINFDWIDLLKLIIRDEGDTLIYLMITILATFLYIKNKKVWKTPSSFIIILSIILSNLVFYTVYLFNIIPGLQNINAARIMSFFSLFTGIPVAYFFKYMIEQRRSIMTLICITIIFTTSIISIYGFVPSPLLFRPSLQVSQMDVSSSSWDITYKNTSIDSIYIQTSPLYKIAGLTIGYTQKQERNDLGNVTTQISDHFNYSNYSGLGYSYTEDKYTLIHKMDKITYTTIWKVVERFEEKDFATLEDDVTVDKLYSNNECCVYYIHSVQ